MKWKNDSWHSRLIVDPNCTAPSGHQDRCHWSGIWECTEDNDCTNRLRGEPDWDMVAVDCSLQVHHIWPGKMCTWTRLAARRQSSCMSGVGCSRPAPTVASVVLLNQSPTPTATNMNQISTKNLNHGSCHVWCNLFKHIEAPLDAITFEMVNSAELHSSFWTLRQVHLLLYCLDETKKVLNANFLFTVSCNCYEEPSDQCKIQKKWKR
jgi:hypothetical protein